ncbi:hypothetical protein GCM10010109_89430 [Actinoplanes campanulatus]|nr:hypothetical protein GCM10010109_89430 [Actinoplanes campanulatus]GID42493.1 hypothetical protein Aca09nite_89990 [Actinoplanes campanulatus]
MTGATAGCGLPLPAIESGRSDNFSFPYPTEGRPERIAIDHNTFEAENVGHTADGGQFFLTTPFEPGGRSFVALYLFDRDGGSSRRKSILSTRSSTSAGSRTSAR